MGKLKFFWPVDKFRNPSRGEEISPSCLAEERAVQPRLHISSWLLDACLRFASAQNREGFSDQKQRPRNQHLASFFPREG